MIQIFWVNKWKIYIYVCKDYCTSDKNGLKNWKENNELWDIEIKNKLL